MTDLCSNGDTSLLTNKLNDANHNMIKQNTLTTNGFLHDLNESIQANNEFENELKYLNANQSQINDTQIVKFQKLIESKYKLTFDTYNDLYKWSIDNNVDFWREFFHFSNITHSKPYEKVLDTTVPFENVPEWFHGCLLNYAENLLRHGDDDKVAIYATGEYSKDNIKSITFKQLRHRVKLYQNALKSFGIKKGDRVVGYMPNSIECLEAKLATVSLGAIWSCTSPDFGSTSVLDRFKQIEPKLMFSVCQVAYNNKIHNHKDKLNEVLHGLDTIEKVVIVPFTETSLTSESIKDVPKSCLLDDFLKTDNQNNGDDATLTFEQVPFNHPLAILYSSGTTGAPKCIVHSHGGTLIQHLKEHMLHGNVNKDDIILYYTTAGWMMYNWLISSLALGATIVLYDGSPIVPKIDILWDIVDKLNVTMFGASAKYLALMEEKKVCPIKTHKLAKLKNIYSTGSPLKPSSFDYVYKDVKTDVLLCSITGGTDIISLFCGHHVNLPVYKSEIQCRHLGMAVECWDESGKHVFNSCGELVCTKPFPSMPVYFWKDKNNEKYHASYFEKYKNVWAHGDFCMINSITGGVIMYGRSDGTLNPNGVRFGSAEIYNVIESFEEIEDSLCVAQRNPNALDEERVILFIKVAPNFQFNNELETKVKTTIRNQLSPRHVPALVLPIADIPYTLNGKKVEVPIRRIIEGHNVAPSTSLANPQSLELFKNIEALKKW